RQRDRQCSASIRLLSATSVGSRYGTCGISTKPAPSMPRLGARDGPLPLVPVVADIDEAAQPPLGEVTPEPVRWDTVRTEPRRPGRSECSSPSPPRSPPAPAESPSVAVVASPATPTHRVSTPQ